MNSHPCNVCFLFPTCGSADKKDSLKPTAITGIALAVLFFAFMVFGSGLLIGLLLRKRDDQKSCLAFCLPIPPKITLNTSDSASSTPSHTHSLPLSTPSQSSSCSSQPSSAASSNLSSSSSSSSRPLIRRPPISPIPFPTIPESEQS